MSGDVDFTLPWPPSNNRYWRNFRGKIRLSPEAHSYREVVGLLVTQLGLRGPLRGRLSVQIDCHPPDGRGNKRDVDNMPKAILDSLEAGGLFLDDNQIDRLLVQRREIISGGCVRVRVSEIRTPAPCPVCGPECRC